MTTMNATVSVNENDLRPIAPPAYGRETALAVLNIVKLHPELHDQGEWELRLGTNDKRVYSDDQNTPVCRTTRCIAGWTQWLHEGLVHDSAYDDPNDVTNAARRYLDLNENDANLLWYSTDERAVRALEYLAAGEPIDWNAIREQFPRVP